MRLRKPCEHGRYDKHNACGVIACLSHPLCPGGEFLTEDALVIEKVDGEWPMWVYQRWPSPLIIPRTGAVDEILNALTVREGVG